MYSLIRKHFTTLLLALLLGLPSIAVADHLHQDYNDQIHCDLCSASSPAAVNSLDSQDRDCTERQQEPEQPARIPFEIFRINQYQRGPPLLR